MAMRMRTRSKRLRQSQQLLGSGVNAHGYAIGVIGPDPRGTVAVLVVIFAVAIAFTFVVFGVIVIPGVSVVLLVVALHVAIDRPASVAVTNQGIAVLARSEVNGQPRRILTVLPHAVLTDGTVRRSGAYVHLPNFHLWFRKKEYERLLAAVSPSPVTSQWAPPAPAAVGAQLPSPPIPASAAPNGAVAIAPSPAAPTMTGSPALQLDTVSDVIYCSWCGKQRATNAQAIHHC